MKWKKFPEKHEKYRKMFNFHAVLLLLSTTNHLNVFSLRTKKNPIEIVPHLKWMCVAREQKLPENWNGFFRH